MERQLVPFTLCASALAATVCLLLAKACLLQERGELIAKTAASSLGSYYLKCSGMQRCARDIRGGKALQVFSQGGSKRQDKAFSGLADLEADLAPDQIDIVPAQLGQVIEPLAGVEPAKDQALPFRVGYLQEPLDFRHAKRAPGVIRILPDRLQEFGRVLQDITVAPG